MLDNDIVDIKNNEKSNFLKYKNNQITDIWSKYSYYDFEIHGEDRDKRGAFYTPKWVVKFMVRKAINDWIEENHIQNLAQTKILEPSCGSGNFLQIIYEELINLLPDNQFQTIKDKKNHIISNMIYGYDIDEKSVSLSQKRLFEISGFNSKNITIKNTLKTKDKFDIIIGNPPYGNLLSKEEKLDLKDTYSNIALNFLDWSFKCLKQKGVSYLIVPHSFSRTGGGSQKWRNLCKQEKRLYEVIDVGNPFFDITLEEIIVGQKKEDNTKIQTGSLRFNVKGNNVSYEDFFHEIDNAMIIYWDKFYKEIQESIKEYPFSGKRGKEFSKKDLPDFGNKEDYYQYVLGKNVSKNGLKSINNYDKYICKVDVKYQYTKDKLVVITQFGTNLKATILDTKIHYPSGGVVVVEYEGLEMKEAVDYLNNEVINYILNRYILNEAKLTVHIDGRYLEKLPYIKNKDFIKRNLTCMKEE